MRQALILLFLFLIENSHAQSVDPSAQKGYKSIDTMDLKKHISVLAADSLEGRETTYPGQKKAANYIAGIFKKLNLKAIGDSGSYFQHFNVELTRVDPATKIYLRTGEKKEEFEWQKDFIGNNAKDTMLSGPAAFIGYTDTQLDSASQAKLKGRIVFVFIGKKSYVNDNSMPALMQRFRAARHDPGIGATLMIPDETGAFVYDRIVRIHIMMGYDKGSMVIEGNVSHNQSAPIRFFVSRKLVEVALKPSGYTLEQIRRSALEDKDFKPLFIDSISIFIKSNIIKEIRQTENVLGLLQGSDSTLRNEVVAITAHYDHLGKSIDGTIYPGADDNASGTSEVLELAEAFSRDPIKPGRSLLFMTVAGEEKGLLGSQFYADHPVIPLNQIFADINIDMVGRIDTVHELKREADYIYVIGSDKISLQLDSLLRAANNESAMLDLDYFYNNENEPEQLYRRSDHYNFAKNGVPIVFFFDGFHADYHRPTDTVDKIKFDRMSKVCRLIYNLGWKLGNLGHPLLRISN